MTTPKYFDITPIVSDRLGVFPGDRKFQRKVSLDFASGQHLQLSSIETTLHLGAHVDAPNHYDPEGSDIASRDLSFYMGPCEVKTAQVELGEVVGTKHLRDANPLAKRVIVRTNTFPDPENWNSNFAGLAPELIRSWGEAGVVLVGIDTPSIDPENSKTLDAHKEVARLNMAILEGVVLSGVPDGVYHLMALPLRIESADASPVRALLFKDLLWT